MTLMTQTRINADFSRKVVLRTNDMPWHASPQPGVARRLLDRIGDEVARATSLVRYAPGSTFSAHVHEAGEEFLVLEGVFSDGEGDYRAGTYVRNPPGSQHAPFTVDGCTIFVKLRQMPAHERDRRVVETWALPFVPTGEPFTSSIALHCDPSSGERVALERLDAGAWLRPPCGYEIYVVSGELLDGPERHGVGTWLRDPSGDARLWADRETTYWIKTGHIG